jgi:hypothetical protein
MVRLGQLIYRLIRDDASFTGVKVEIFLQVPVNRKQSLYNTLLFYYFGTLLDCIAESITFRH